MEGREAGDGAWEKRRDLQFLYWKVKVVKTGTGTTLIPLRPKATGVDHNRREDIAGSHSK